VKKQLLNNSENKPRHPYGVRAYFFTVKTPMEQYKGKNTKRIYKKEYTEKEILGDDVTVV
jgi:hypothetical protein